MNKKLLFPVIASAIVGMGLIGAAGVNAQDAQIMHYPPIVQKLVERFGLNEADVKAVFDEVRVEHHKEMHARVEENLNQAVAAGELTEAQKQLILSKMEELKSKHMALKENFQNMTAEEHKSQMEAHRNELETWAKENNIDLKYLRFTVKFGHGPGKFVGMKVQ